MSSKFENIFRINRKSLFATLSGFETPGTFFRVYLNLKHSAKRQFSAVSIFLELNNNFQEGVAQYLSKKGSFQ